MFAVFFPSLMGLGIIASGMVLLSDLLVRALPNRGRRRNHRVAIGAFGVVARAAAAAGQPVRRSQMLDRVPRRRATYAAGAIAVVAAGALTTSAALAAHRDPLGVFYRSPWMIGIAVAAIVVAASASLLSSALAIFGDRPPPPLAAIVGGTFLGRLQIPPGPVDGIGREERP